MGDTLLSAVSGLTFGILLVTMWIVAKTGVALARMERKVDALVKHAGIDLPALAVREAEALVRGGRKIDAIRVYRELTGASLADAKAAIDQMQ